MRNYASNIDSRMFDFKKHYDWIAEQLPINCRIVECGIADGASAIYLCEKILNLGKNIEKFYWVDSMAYGKYNQLVTIYEHIIASGLGDYVKVIPLDSVEASHTFNGDSLDMVFLDSSHKYSATKKEIKSWYGKLKDNGILSGHDFYSKENSGVRKAVEELLPQRIRRKTINEPDHFQEFEEENFLVTEQTERELGVWYCYKKFYFTP